MDIRDNKTGSMLTELKNACSKTGYGVVYLPYKFNDGVEIDSLFQMLSDSSAIHNAIGDSPGILPADMSELEEAIGDSDGLQFNPLSEGWRVVITKPRARTDTIYPPVPTMSQASAALAGTDPMGLPDAYISGFKAALTAFRKINTPTGHVTEGEAEQVGSDD